MPAVVVHGFHGSAVGWYGADVTDTPTDANTVDALLLSVEGWIVDGEVDRAREALRSLRSRGVEDPEIDYLDGVACWREGEDEAAQVHFEAAIQLDPEHSDAHHGLFMLFEALDAHEDSVRCGLEVLRLDALHDRVDSCLLYTSPSPRDVEESRMPSSA